ncbi:hypothetical protein K504DRAFT_452972 [Pleomassaria siparia CBS 279.74]|uniref:Uncharacterized protein n=1 Tax=Pleomassaria siparia CBS 279.74 TaxID=1314801 RepID=A0A6G1JQ46_9PLEO|nr:hypothetical protein K504DRAFT_452972 [Pleomassaria siparia CBS 279.74]
MARSPPRLTRVVRTAASARRRDSDVAQKTSRYSAPYANHAASPSMTFPPPNSPLSQPRTGADNSKKRAADHANDSSKRAKPRTEHYVGATESMPHVYKESKAGVSNRPRERPGQGRGIPSLVVADKTIGDDAIPSSNKEKKTNALNTLKAIGQTDTIMNSRRPAAENDGKNLKHPSTGLQLGIGRRTVPYGISPADVYVPSPLGQYISSLDDE